MPELEAATTWLWWINWAKIVGAFLVAIGVAAEFLGDFIARPYEDAIENARKKELAQLHKESDEARAAIADANARAVEAQLALERFKAPRILSPEQERSVISKLPDIALNAVSVGSSPVTFETATFAEQLLRILAKYRASGNSGAAANLVGIATGIIILHVTGNEEATAVANALAGALRDEGISVEVTGGMHEGVFEPHGALKRTDLGSRNMLVVVGEKPK